MIRPILSQKWKNGCKMTVERMAEENGAKLKPEVIEKINRGVAEFAEKKEQAGLHREQPELADWQWENILAQETENEDQE